MSALKFLLSFILLFMFVKIITHDGESKWFKESKYLGNIAAFIGIISLFGCFISGFWAIWGW